MISYCFDCAKEKGNIKLQVSLFIQPISEPEKVCFATLWQLRNQSLMYFLEDFWISILHRVFDINIAKKY